MCAKPFFRTAVFTLLLTGCLLAACLLAACSAPSPARLSAAPTPPVEVTPTPGKPAWFSVPLTDVRTGATFTVNDFAGKVVLIQTISTSCSECANQQHELTKMAVQLSLPDDLIVISLDVDPKEDAALLKKYVDYFKFDWRFVMAPLDVTRALGNLYSAEYLNPPLEPMLIVDRNGDVYGLPNGFKSANALGNTLLQYLR